MVRIEPDVGKNRLVIELSGTPTPAELAPLEERLREAIARLRRPFDVLSDVTGLQSLEVVGLDPLVALGQVLGRAGVRRVVRVVGRSSQGAVHMERVARQLRSAAHLAFSRAEAERLLDRW